MIKAITLFVGMCLITVSSIGQNPYSSMEKNAVSLHRKTTTETNQFHGQKIKTAKQGLPENFRLPNRHTQPLQPAGAIKHRLDYEIDEEYDNNSSQFVLSEKYEYNYDADQNMVQALIYGRDETATQWIFLSKEENTYDVNRNVTQTLSYYWDANTSQFIFSYKSEFIYDADNNMIQYTGSQWNAEASLWVVSGKQESAYDANGNLLQFISYSYDSAASEYVNQWKGEFTYNANALTQYLAYQWDPSLSLWMENEKYEYTTDVNGRITQSLDYYWNPSTSQWELSYKNVYGYDANGNPTLEEYFWMDGNTGTFVESNKYDYTYDLSFNLSNLILPPFSFFLPDFSDEINNKTLGYLSYFWDEGSNNWMNNNKGTYYYSDQIISSVNKINGNISEIYPIPVSSFLSFSFLENMNQVTFELFDTQGRKLMTKVLANNAKVNMQELNTGMYFYKLTGAAKIQTGKIIKE